MLRSIGTVCLALLAGSGILLADRTARGQGPFPTDRPFDLTADEVEYERARDLYVARGNVHIRQEGRTLEADWVSFNNTTRIGVASGDVVLRDGTDTLHAEFVQFDIDTLRGVVYDGRLDAPSSRFRMEGEEVRRTGEQTYQFRRGRFTTCRCPDPGRDPWAIEVEKADLEVGGYGTARNSTFEVLGVPVLWLPWAIFPLKTERQTGFLLPTGGASADGVDLELPFFWAARHNVNVLLTPEWIHSRGFKPNLGLEYVFGERSQGTFAGSFLHDVDIDPDDPSTPFSENRWALQWQHDHHLPAGWRFQADGKFASDNLHPLDLRDLGDYRTDRYLESTGFLSRHFGRFDRVGLRGGVRWADDLAAPDDSDRDDVVLQRLPEVDLTVLPGRFRGLSRLVRSLDLQYAHFRPQNRPEGKYPTAAVVGDDLFLDTGVDGTPNVEERDALGSFGAPDGSLDDFPLDGENDGLFQEGEPLADRGHRVVVAPRFGLPIRLADLFELYPEVGYHGTFYDSDEQGYEDRHLATGRLELRGQLRGDLGLPLGGGRLQHVLEPRVGWAMVSSTSQRSNPLYVPPTAVPQDRLRQLELDNVTRDPADRIARFNGIVFGLGNRFFHAPGGGEPPRLRADVTLSAAYDFSASEWGLVLLQGVLDPLTGLRSRFLVGYDSEESRLAEAGVRLLWTHAAGHELGMHYRYVRDIPDFFEAYRFDDERFDEFEDGLDRVNQVGVVGRVALTRQWAVSGRYDYSFEQSFVMRGGGSLEYVSRCQCWAVALEVTDERGGGFDVRLRYTLIGLGGDAARPFGSPGLRFGR